MPAGWTFDWGTFWLLAAITLAEGFRRVPAGSLLLRRVPGYPWQVAAGPYRATGWRLASVFSPLALHCLVTPGDAPATPIRLRRGWITLLRVPGFISLVALLVGVPLLAPSRGIMGLIIAVAAMLGASLLAAVLAMVALTRMGTGWKRAAGDAVRLLSPFTSPRAPEIVLERVFAGVPAAEAARALLPPADFIAWVRPFAYDQVMRDASAVVLPRDEAERILRQPPSDASAGDVYCPRCASTYLPGIESCHACQVPLERMAADREARIPVAAAG